MFETATKWHRLHPQAFPAHSPRPPYCRAPQGSDWDELDAELDEALDEALGLSSSPMSDHTTLEAQHDYTRSPDPHSYSPTRRGCTPAPCLPSTVTQPAQHPQQPPELRRGLEGLPIETLMRVCSFLSAEDLRNAARCNRLLARLCAEPVLWRRLFRARWGSTRQAGSAASWKVRGRLLVVHVRHCTVWFSAACMCHTVCLSAVFHEHACACRHPCNDHTISLGEYAKV